MIDNKSCPNLLVTEIFYEGRPGGIPQNPQGDFRMGKERDELIRRLGGTPVSDMNLSDREIIELAWDTYYKRGELPPAIREILEQIEKEDEKNPE